MKTKSMVRFGIAGLAIVWSLVGLGFGWLDIKAAGPILAAAVSALFGEKDYLKASKSE